MKSLIVKEDGLIYAAEVLEKPKFVDTMEAVENCLNDKAMADWRKTINDAAVLVADQEKAVNEIWYEHCKSATTGINYFEWKQNLKPGIYPIPGLQWEVRTLSKGGWHEKDGIHFNEYDVAVLTLTNESDMARYEANLYAEVNTETKIGFDIAVKAYYDGFRKAVAILKESTPSTEQESQHDKSLRLLDEYMATTTPEEKQAVIDKVNRMWAKSEQESQEEKSLRLLDEWLSEASKEEIQETIDKVNAIFQSKSEPLSAEESQAELWQEAEMLFNTYSNAINELKIRFTITRKP